ncbi:MAG TPA: NAD(P)-dependent oxidoreductase [Verrucomicrobiae bacterium]|nr:NAD(P)-dependent oxidoreductase [Verrucomicrobiae bacterium]
MPLENPAPKLPAEQYEKNFAEISPPMNSRQAAVESARCLYCFDAPCIQACPTRIDIPSFIRKISTGNLLGSARVILEANILGHSCGRVCPTEVLCEGACVMHEKGVEPIEIGRLQRHAVDYVLDRRIQLFHPGPPNGKRIACIGAGPASLAAAADLAKLGYSVVLFDRNKLPGGLDTYGIAAYKLRAGDALREIGMIAGLGVEIRPSTEIGRDIFFPQLEKEFDAILIGVGLGETWDLSIPGEDLDGVVGAMEFIAPTKTKAFFDVPVGRRIACIGAGNTAIDVVTAARRLGAEIVHLLYRRGEKEMPAFRYEYDLAKLDGVTFHWFTQPLRILGRDGRVSAVECLRTRLEPGGSSGKPKIVPVPGSEFSLEVDMVVRAIGQKPVTEAFRSLSGVEIRSNGTIATNALFQTGRPQYFAAGDCVNGGKEVVDAVAEGMAAARGMDRWLGAPRGKN